MMERTVLFYDFHRQYRMPRSQNVLRLGQNRSLGPTGPDSSANDDLRAILGCRTHPYCLPGFDGGNLAKGDRRPVARGDDYPRQFVSVADKGVGPNGKPLPVAVDESTADTGVVTF